MSVVGDFFGDVGLDDVMKVYSEIEVAKAKTATAKYEAQAREQVETLDPPEYDSGSDAIGGGNAVVPGAKPQSYFDRIPKELLAGSALLLGGALFIKAVT